MLLLLAAASQDVGGIIDRTWERLADETKAVPFAHPGWVHAWAGNRPLSLISAGPINGRGAVIPMLRSAGPTLETPTDWHSPVFEAIATDEQALRDLAGELIRSGAHRIVLGFLDAAAPTFLTLRAQFEQSGYRLECRPRMESPYVDLAGGWDDYLASLPTRKRSELRRRRRRLEESGRVTIEVYDGTGNLNSLLSEGFEVEAASWKGTEGTAITSDPRTERLYREAAQWASRRGWLRLAFLRIDGRPIAFDYCIEDDSTHYLLKTGYDPAFRKHAPGSLLRLEMIERAFAAGLDTYEFAGSAESWKLEWTRTARHIVELTAYAPTAAGRIMQAAARPLRFLRRSLGRTSPEAAPR